MATTFTIKSSSYQGRYLQLTCTQTKNVAANTSTIAWTLTSTGGTSSYYSTGATTVKINGEQVYYKARVGYSAQTFPAAKGSTSGTITVKHNSDGSLSIPVSLSTAIYTTSISTVSGTWALDDIPRASSVSATAANIGSATKITINRAVSSFTHTLTYSFSGLTGTIATKTTNTSVSWTVPTSFYAKIPNAKSGTCTITCETFSGSTSIGTKTTTFKATAAESACKPTLSPTAVDKGSVSITLTGDANNKIIKGYNSMAVDTGAAARNSATLKSYKITCGGKSITTASGTLSHVESGTFTFSATDSRGYTTTQTLTKTLINYVDLTCNLTASAPTTAGDMSFTVKGNCFNGSFGTVTNTLTVEYRYKVNNGSYGSWAALTATRSGNTYTANGKLTGLDYQSSYTIQARAVDKIDSVSSAEKKVKTTPVFDWGEDDFKFNVPVNMNIGSNSYSLLGLLYAMTTTYELDCTVTPGANYTSATCAAHLVGNSLRLGITAKRSSAANAGNVTNENVMTVNVNHGGKLNNLYRVDFNSGTDGGLAAFDVQATKVDDENVKLTIALCATATSGDSWNAYFVMPCTIKTKAYV